MLIPRTFRAAVGAVGLGLLGIAHAGTDAALDPAVAQATHTIQAAIDAGRLTGVSVALVQHGRIVWEQGFGYADREAGRKATAHTAFSIASTSKPFTTTAMMTLVDAGKLALDRPANDYLHTPSIVDDNGPAQGVTLRRIASHSSGMPTFFTMYPNGAGQPGVPDLLRDYGHLVAVPGEHYEYSNLGMATLAEVVAQQSGQDFGSYLEQRVFAPLGMNDSFFGSNLQRAPEGAVRYADSGHRLPYYLTGTPGSGEVYASAHDLATFAMLHLKDPLAPARRILSAAQIDELHRPHTPVAPGHSYGMGWQIWQPDGQPPVLYHGGGQVGVAAEFVLVPAADAACIVLSNRHNDNKILAQVRDVLLGAVVPGWHGIPQPPQGMTPVRPAASYAGVWRGTLLAQGRKVPVELTVAADGKSARFALDGKPAREVTELGIDADGILNGNTSGDIGSRDTVAFGVDKLELDLRLRGNRMNGEVVAWKKTDDNMTVLPHWIDLVHQH